MHRLHISRKNSSLKEQVTNQLRSAVLDGALEPGQKLVERDLCEMLDISRTVLREALQQLVAEGLIISIPHRGPEVASITLKQAKNIYDVRQAIEALAVTCFVKNATDKQISELKNTLHELEAVLEGSTDSSILDIKNKFYKVLLDGCDNEILLEMHTLLNNRINLLRRTSLSSKGRLKQTVAEINEIVSAIENRDAKLASELNAKHVAIAAEIAIGQLKQKQNNASADN